MKQYNNKQKINTRIAVLYPQVYETLVTYFKGQEIELFLTDKNQPLSEYDFVIMYNEFDFDNNTAKIINVHPSLLPAYKNKNAITEAFNDGVKVSGVTIHMKDKIIAQYPILIGIETHADDFMKEVHQIAAKLLPPILDCILKDKVFDFHDLFASPCHKTSGCNGCSKCKE